MNLFEQLEYKVLEVDNDLRVTAEREGFDKLEVTGNLIMDSPNEAVWFEVVDLESNTISWVSLDFPERTAYGEKLVAIADRSEMQDYGK